MKRQKSVDVVCNTLYFFLVVLFVGLEEITYEKRFGVPRFGDILPRSLFLDGRRVDSPSMAYVEVPLIPLM